MKVTLVKVLKEKHYPAAWVLRYPPIQAGTVVPAVPATNIPEKGCMWVNTPELEDDAYGILLHRDEYQIID